MASAFPAGPLLALGGSPGGRGQPGGPCATRGPHWALWGPGSLHTAGPGGQHTLAWRHRDSLGSVNGDVRFFDPRMPESVNVLQIVKGLTALDIHPQASLIAW